MGCTSAKYASDNDATADPRTDLVSAKEKGKKGENDFNNPPPKEQRNILEWSTGSIAGSRVSNSSIEVKDLLLVSRALPIESSPAPYCAYFNANDKPASTGKGILRNASPAQNAKPDKAPANTGQAIKQKNKPAAGKASPEKPVPEDRPRSPGRTGSPKPQKPSREKPVNDDRPRSPGKTGSPKPQKLPPVFAVPIRDKIAPEELKKPKPPNCTPNSKPSEQQPAAKEPERKKVYAIIDGGASNPPIKPKEPENVNSPAKTPKSASPPPPVCRKLKPKGPNGVTQENKLNNKSNNPNLRPNSSEPTNFGKSTNTAKCVPSDTSLGAQPSILKRNPGTRIPGKLVFIEPNRK